MVRVREKPLGDARPPVFEKLEAAVRDHSMRDVRLDIENDLPDGPVKSALVLFKASPFYGQGYRIAVKGGAIRDLLTGKPPSDEADVDFAAGKIGEHTPISRDEKKRIRGFLIGKMRESGHNADVDVNVADLTYHYGGEIKVGSSFGVADFTVNDVAFTCDGEVVDEYDGVEAAQLGRITLVPTPGTARIMSSDTILRGLRMDHQFPDFVMDAETSRRLFRRPIIPQNLRRHTTWRLMRKALTKAADIDAVLNDFEETGLLDAIAEVSSKSEHYVNVPTFDDENAPDDNEIRAAEEAGTISQYFAQVPGPEFVRGFIADLPEPVAGKLTECLRGKNMGEWNEETAKRDSSTQALMFGWANDMNLAGRDTVGLPGFSELRLDDMFVAADGTEPVGAVYFHSTRRGCELLRWYVSPDYRNRMNASDFLRQAVGAQFNRHHELDEITLTSSLDQGGLAHEDYQRRLAAFDRLLEIMGAEKIEGRVGQYRFTRDRVA
ncbi:MAG: hypothetical protein ABH834_02695 [Candidatus Altiarchaeota archaeon]